MSNKGRLIIISGPSGAGKGTVLQEVFSAHQNMCYSISATTRGPRVGEQDGVHYFFITKAEFEEKLRRGEMLEHTVYCGNYYGTPADYVESRRKEGFDVILEIEPNGAGQVKAKCSDAISIFILPPSIEELEKRLINRGTEPPEVIAKRIQRAKEEIVMADQYDYQVVNDTVEHAAMEINKILFD